MNHRATLFRLMLVAALGLLTAAGVKGQGGGPVQFDRDIRPILSDHCFACHGPDGAKRKGGLRLDTREGVLGSAKDGGQVVVPGQPAQSVLIRRIAPADALEVMPPPRSGKPLTTAQVDLLRRWVAEGATWTAGWAWSPPRQPPLPVVKQAGWPRNEVDHFILAALEQRGWAPASEASPVTLLRRVSYDLTGLPPTPAEVDAFLADTAPAAYERVVDRLLAAPAFGERMAQHWLDLARYADSDGYHDDYLREMHAYRDYVIDTFNRNLPFDQFTTEQLAGDLLPQPSQRQLVATAFLRNGPTTSEMGADAEEYRLRYAAERVSTTATVWLGLSLACAECHDHKYDPLPTRDFYRMFALFDQLPGNPLANGAQAQPLLRIVPQGMESELREAEQLLEQRQAALRKLYYEPRSDWDRAQAGWEQRLRETKLEPMRLGEWRWSGPYQPERDGDTERFLPELAQVDHNRDAVRRIRWTTSIQTNKNTFILPARLGVTYLQREIVATTSGLLRCRVNPDVRVQAWLNERLVHVSGRDAETAGPIKFFNLRIPAGRHQLLFKLVPADAGGEIVFEAGESAAHRLRLESFKQQKQLDVPAAQRTTNDLTAIRRAFRELHVSEIDAAQFAAEAAQARYAVASKNSSRVRVMAEPPAPVPTRVLLRGDFRRPGERVTAGVPAVFAGPGTANATNRLEFARWLTARDNPLTARVTVNRFWQMFFGTGIVKTSEDFGAQGEAPTHPELLDHLAVRFMAGGWDVKATLRLLVTSAAYRQSSRFTGSGASADPENRWLARGPRFRLPAEFIRDTALAASGLLDRSRAPEGRSVLPYQPGPDLWKEFAFGESLKYIQDHGGELYRRGVYLFWKRSVLHPYLAVLDAPTRDVCTPRRPVTNTPTQALALLNETLLVECARVLAQRLLVEVPGDDAARLRRAFRLVLAREPVLAEEQILLALHADTLRHYQSATAAAKQLTRIGEFDRPSGLDAAQHAAWQCVCNALFNLDETLTKE